MALRRCLAATLPLLWIGGASGQGLAYGMFFGCPCVVGTFDDAACTTCLSARCSVGGGTIERGCVGQPWCASATAYFRATCNSMAPIADTSINSELLCNEVDPCGIACAGLPAGCLGDCEEIKVKASAACSRFPWPVLPSYQWLTTPPPVATLTTTLPHIFM
mmetsp:Transcript_75451/g.191504  ORF Transcript_75451/g.191504 Transcript_75451/m.191504 type:complete len:162 (+) Transcript_75451:125-610(+)